MLMSKAKAQAKGIKPLATIRSIGFAGVDPTIMGQGPVPASLKALDKMLGMAPGDIDYWEINEAFAIVALNCIKQLGLDPERVNVMGGGLAIGHPSGGHGQPSHRHLGPHSGGQRTPAGAAPTPAWAAARAWPPSSSAKPRRPERETLARPVFFCAWGGLFRALSYLPYFMKWSIIINVGTEKAYASVVMGVILAVMTEQNSYKGAVFAGGGSRCFWQAGFWRSAAPRLWAWPPRRWPR